MSSLNIGILGAGVVGLSTALQVQNEFRNANVEIIADTFTEDTTSFVAAGLFRPGTSFSGPNEDITRYLNYLTFHNNDEDNLNQNETMCFVLPVPFCFHIYVM